MRVTLDKQVLHGGSDAPYWAEWFVLEDGLDGWYSAPAPQIQSETNPAGHGSFWPSEFYSAARVITLQFAHASTTSSLARAEAEDWVASLNGRIPFVVEDEHGVRSVEVHQSAEPDYHQYDVHTAAFTLFLTAPDPIKYGPPRSFTGDTVRNEGTTAVLPWAIKTRGATTHLTAVIGGHRIRWAGSAPSGLEIDTRLGRTVKGTPGVLAEDDIRPLAPGSHTLALTTDALEAWVELSPGWL